MLTNYDPKNRSLHLLGLYEKEIYSFLKKGISRADTLIDIGANDGYYGLAFAKFKGKEIILCEPGQTEKANLISNLGLNDLKEKRDFTLVDKFVTRTSSLNEISIQDLLRSKKKVFILMDVDGGEQQVIEGFDFSQKIEVAWLIETHSKELEENIVRILETNGYKVRIIKNAWWRMFVPEMRPLAHNRWMYAVKEL